MKKWLAFTCIAAVAIAIWAALAAEPEPTVSVAAAESGFQVGDRLPEPAPPAEGEEVLELGWADLIPDGWITEEMLANLNVDDLDDNDPRAATALQKIREEWDRAPVVEELGGRKVRIPGFVAPLEGDGETIREFLLVPYFGACVHVPPPPSNQLIHVLPGQPIPGDWDMRPVWVAGVLSIIRVDSALGSAGYQLEALIVEEYDEPMEEQVSPH